MFAQLETATGEQRRDLFHQLVSELIRHEVAEEEILRPVSKRDAGEEIANARIHEESQAEELLKEMESLDTDSPEFAAKLATLRHEVERHAEAEETQEFPKVMQKESVERLEQMGKGYADAKKEAPTLPPSVHAEHPGRQHAGRPFRRGARQGARCDAGRHEVNLLR